MYAICPNCGDTVEDLGEERFIKCDNCGRTIHSRVYGKSKKLSTNLDHESYVIYMDPRIKRDDFGEIHDKLHDSRLKPKVSPINAVFGFFSTLAILFFIFVLLFNFIVFFPAIAITTPNLLSEHQLKLDSEIPVIIDNTPPNITYPINKIVQAAPGQIIDIAVQISEEHLKESYLELLDSNLKQYNLRFDVKKEQYTTSIQAPELPGPYDLNIIAVDYSGNLAKLKLELEVTNQVEYNLILSTPKQFNYINSSTVFTFAPWPSEISNVSYTLNSNPNDTTLDPSGKIKTKDWPEGENHLNLTINTESNILHYQNFSISIDNSPPEVEFLSVKSLTLDRKDTFRGRVNKTTYYRGEFVKVNTRFNELDLLNPRVIIKNKTYELTKVSLDTIESDNSKDMEFVYQTIFSLPNKPGNYKLRLIANDLAGNTKIYFQKIQVAKVNFDYISVPIIKLTPNDKTILNLPYINSSSVITIRSKIGDITELEYSRTNLTVPGSSTISLNPDENISFIDIPEGIGSINIKSKIEYQTWDYLFITFPYPPYLFVLPVLLTGWYLVGFFIFIAVAIILSNLFLLKNSLSGAFTEIKKSFLKLQGPMIDSKNSIIVLAQLFLTVFSFSVIYNFLLALNRVSTHTPDFSSLSLWTLIYNLTSAAVYEEIISRVLLIGIPLLLIHVLLKKTKKEKWRYLIGGGFKINKLTVFLILFSSLTFGLAHAPGWDYWKVVPSFVSGLALGYLFVTKGLYLSIILHFSINFLSIPLIMANYPLGPTIIFSFLVIFWIIIGAVYITYYLKKFIIKLIPHRNKRSMDIG